MRKKGIIRIVLADDHAMVRQGLAQLLEEDGNIKIIGQACNGLEAVEMAKSLKPDVIVLDYTMPLLDGASAALKIRRLCPHTRILILTVHENVHYAIRALKAGVHGFVIKAAAVQELIQGIRSVCSGAVYVSPTISGKILSLPSENKGRTGLEALSGREFELLRLLCSGKKLNQCAKQMHITESAASTYRSRMMRKLNISSNVELVRFAMENGIVG